MQNGPLKRPHHLGKQGNFAQLGGDFVFGPGMLAMCTILSEICLMNLDRRNVFIRFEDATHRGP